MEETYVEAWKDYRRRRQMYATSFLSFPLVGLVVVLLKSALAFAIIGATWMIFSIVSMTRFGTFRCPRCQKRFFSTSFTNNPFAAKCLNCGLPKWAVSPEAGIPWTPRFRMTRKIWWRVMLGGATISGLVQLFTGSWAAAWPSMVLSLMAIVILHPLMDRDLETLFDSGMLRSWKAYAGIVLLAISILVMFRK